MSKQKGNYDSGRLGGSNAPVTRARIEEVLNTAPFNQTCSLASNCSNKPFESPHLLHVLLFLAKTIMLVCD